MSDNWRWVIVGGLSGFTAIMTLFNWLRLIEVEKLLKKQ